MADILVVEDDETLQQAYSFILTANGHAVKTAFNGAEALDRIDERVFDVILLDIHMPVMDGFEFLEKYNGSKAAETKVIVFSNMVEPATEKRAAKLGAHGCVLKSSMTPGGMLGLIDETLASR